MKAGATPASTPAQDKKKPGRKSKGAEEAAGDDKAKKGRKRKSGAD
jgi:hypothetical protein